MGTQKIRGASIQEYAGLKFKSKLEVACYKKLEQSGLWFRYEPTKFNLFNGPRLFNIDIFAPKKLSPGKYSKELVHETQNKEKPKKLRDITYTPDFEVQLKGIRAYFDVKGKENDVYPIKKKLFLNLLEEAALENSYCHFMFFEPHSVGQMVEAIEIIKEYEEKLYN